MNCPKCNAVLGASTKFCTKCGYQLTAAMQQPAQPTVQAASGICRVCGAKLSPNVKFCTKCGTAQGMPTPAQSAPVQSVPIQSAPIPKPAVAPTPKTASVVPSITRMKNNEKIKLTGQEFTIGKKKEQVDYCISDNSTVSRVHAKIINRGGQYYVLDMGSTNHTYVNSVQVPSGTEKPIANGARIRISNEEFLFQC